MTHDELLAKISLRQGMETGLYAFKAWLALRAVVELTQKYEEFDGVDSEKMKGYRLAMKQVTQAIEKELA